MRAQAGKIGQANAQIQGRGRATSGDSYQSFTVRTESLTTSEVQSLQSGLTRVVDAESFGVKNVSASFGRQIARGAILAIIVSLLLIIIYISARFQWKFAVPVLIALAHDIIITVGIYALLGREVTTATVAAVLTVLGYSIYDTIIIFDRIRENMPLMKRASFRVIGNVSLWETIPRSLATTFITLLPIVSLLLFGGDTLKDFAFALFVGIGAGAYSSIFIAAPLVAMFKERSRSTRAGGTTSTRSRSRSAERCWELRQSLRSPPPPPDSRRDDQRAGRAGRRRRRPGDDIVRRPRTAPAAPQRPSARPPTLRTGHPSSTRP